MLITLKDILALARETNTAIGAFNTPALECVTAVINAAERLNVPVILSHAELHERSAPLSVIGPVMMEAARRAAVPVCVHLDHCESLEYMEQALKLGFTGVMYDGSALSYAENADNTKRAVAMAKRYGAGVEGELGTLPSREGGIQAAAGPVYTDPDLARRFCEETGIDALAPSFGTAHGIYKEEPVLDLERVEAISALTGKPLVMHGGSGIGEEDFRRAIRSGIRKINYYSYMAKAGTVAVRDLLKCGDVIFYHELADVARQAMQADVERALRIFSNRSEQ